MRMIRLEPLRLAVRQRVGRYVAESLRVDEDYLTDEVALTIQAEMLSERLPPETLRSAVEFTVPRFRSWRDQLYATHRGRWWLGWLPAPRFVDEPHTHETVVTVAARWTYPRAATVASGRDYGHTVLKTDPISWKDVVNPW